MVPQHGPASVEAAIDASFLAHLPAHDRAELVHGARLLTLPAGYVLVDGYRDFGGVVVSGVLRVFAGEDATGRSVTYRNVAVGDTVGLGALLGVRDQLWVQTITESCVLSLDLWAVARLRSREPAVALALAQETMRRLQDTSRELRIWIRGSVRQRTIRCLLDLAAERSPRTGPMSIRVSHEQLAASIGSSREAVTRALGELAHLGLVRLGHSCVSITDLSGLGAEIEQR